MAHPDLQWFKYAQLPPHLQAISKPFADLANWVARELPQNAQTERCLEWLLVAKDCAVRGAIGAPPPGPAPTAPDVGAPPSPG